MQGLTLEQQQLFKYIEDADLWRWALTDSKAFHSGLASLQLEFDATKNPAIFEQLLALTPEAVIARWGGSSELRLCLGTATCRFNLAGVVGCPWAQQAFASFRLFD